MPAADLPYSLACERNRAPILAALRALIGDDGRALEIASGTGQHVACFAQGLPHWNWQPSDAQAGGFDSITAWVAREDLRNVQLPLTLCA